MEEAREWGCRVEEGWRMPPKQGVELESSSAWSPCKFLALLCGFSQGKMVFYGAFFVSPMEVSREEDGGDNTNELWEMEVKWKEGWGLQGGRPKGGGRRARCGLLEGTKGRARCGLLEGTKGSRRPARMGKMGEVRCGLGPLQFNRSRMVQVDVKLVVSFVTNLTKLGWSLV